LGVIKAETIFEALAQVTAIKYIGTVEGLESITLRLAKLQPIAYDPKTRASVYLPTQQLHEQFQSALAEIDGSDLNEGSDIPSIAHMFFDALSHRLKTRFESSLPDRNVPDFQTNLNRYHVFRAEVEKEEEKIRSFVNIARSVQSKQRGETPTWNIDRNTPRTFMVGHRKGEGEDEDEESDDEGDDTDNEGLVIMPPMTLLAGKGKKEKTTAKLMKGLITCLSVAEAALRDASGTNRPVRCWGCQDVDDYKKDCFHRWQQCPRKHDPRTIEAFQKNPHEYRQRMDSNRAGGRWKSAGYPSKQTARQTSEIASPYTNPDTWQTLLSSLQQRINNEKVFIGKRDKNKDSDEDEDKEQRQKPIKKKRRKGQAFIGYYKGRAEHTGETRGMVLYGMQGTGKYAFDISDKLPFMEMMIGAGNDDTNEPVHNLSGLLDSGGCCNMGWKDYHEKIHKNFPYLVANYFKLSDKQFKDINIGGIKEGVWITHMIEYWIPFQKAGGVATMTIELAEDLPIATLFGLPFQIKANLKPDWNAHTATSDVFKHTFKLEIQRPERPPLESLDYNNGKETVFYSHEDPASTDDDSGNY
jgi:hypothetical protein